jgi:hypothetical protein
MLSLTMMTECKQHRSRALEVANIVVEQTSYDNSTMKIRRMMNELGTQKAATGSVDMAELSSLVRQEFDNYFSEGILNEHITRQIMCVR